jgi:hypothetical protein
MGDSSGQSAAGEHLRAAKAGLQQVKGLLAQPSPANADQAAAILREVEVQLGCAAAILEKNGSPPDPEFRPALEDLQGEVATLARFLSGADKLLSDWLRAVQTRRGGYTHRGQAAPLVLVNKVTVEG